MFRSMLISPQSFDGGIADEALHEPHAGYTFCSLGALRFTERLSFDSPASNNSDKAPKHPEEVVRWLVHLQTNLLYQMSSLDSEFLDSKPGAKLNAIEAANLLSTHQESTPDFDDLKDSFIDCASMSGRANKVADTCYAFWAGASLHMLEQGNLYDRDAVMKYLLEKTQNTITGGFGKLPGDPPDLYHSYLGLAALSLAGSDEVKTLDAAMCISVESKSRLSVIWRRWDIDA